MKMGELYRVEHTGLVCCAHLPMNSVAGLSSRAAPFRVFRSAVPDSRTDSVTPYGRAALAGKPQPTSEGFFDSVFTLRFVVSLCLLAMGIEGALL